MNITTMIYLADILPNIKNLLGFITLTILTYLLATNIVCFIENIKCPISKNVHAILLAAMVILATASCLIPSEKTIYMMAGAEIGKEVLQSQKVNATLDKVFVLVDKKLDNEIKGENK